MSVIGRLDEQTDAVLISPVSKRRERAERFPDAEAQGAAPAPAGQDAAEMEGARLRPKRSEPLPVWLL